MPRLLLLLGLLLASVTRQAPPPCPQSPHSPCAPRPDSLLHQSDLTYVGAFRLPTGTFGSDTFDFALGWMGGIVYNDPVKGKSLFMKGLQAAYQVSTTATMAQVIIPTTIFNPNTVGLGGLTTALLAQNFADASGGKSGSIQVANGHGTSVVYNGKLIGAEQTQYDGNCAQTKFGWVGNLVFGGQTGPYATSALPVGDRFLGGYATVIPALYRAVLGGSLLFGSLGGSIVSCGPNGPGFPFGFGWFGGG